MTPTREELLERLKKAPVQIICPVCRYPVSVFSGSDVRIDRHTRGESGIILRDVIDKSECPASGAVIHNADELFPSIEAPK